MNKEEMLELLNEYIQCMSNKELETLIEIIETSDDFKIFNDIDVRF